MRIALFVPALVACVQPPPVATATGEVGPWQTAAALPRPRANHCSAVIDDWVLVIGGNYQADGGGFAKTAEIHAARIAADGTLGPWQLAGHTPSPVTECNAASDGRTLYVIDGLYERDSDSRRVHAAELDAGGHLGAPSALGELPAIAISGEAAVRSGALIVMDTELPADGDDTLTLRAPLPGLPWTAHAWSIGFRAQAQYAFGAAHIYTLGGYHDPSEGALAEVFAAPIAGGPARAVTPLPAPVAFGEAVAVDDWLFVAGGRAKVFGAPGSAAVYAAPIAADGSLGAWRESALPVPRTNHELVVAGDFLVLTGGAAMGPGDATVLITRVRS